MSNPNVSSDGTIKPQKITTQLIKAVGSAHFNKIFEKAKNNIFRDFEHIQTVVRHVSGVGEAINIDFKAPFNKNEKEITYLDRYEYVDELKMLKQGKFKVYAHH